MTELMLLPDVVQETYRQYHELEDDNKWVAIDYIVDFIAEMQTAYAYRLGGMHHDLAMRKANAKIIGQFAAVTSEDPSTVRERVRVGKFWQSSRRDEYPILNYSQLRACLSAGDDSAEDYALWAMDYADENQGRPAGARQIREAIKHDRGDVYVYTRDFNVSMSTCRRLLLSDETPNDIRVACMRYLLTLEVNVV